MDETVKNMVWNTISTDFLTIFDTISDPVPDMSQTRSNVQRLLNLTSMSKYESRIGPFSNSKTGPKMSIS